MSSAHSGTNDTVAGGSARPARLMGNFKKHFKREVKVETIPPLQTNNRDSFNSLQLPSIRRRSATATTKCGMCGLYLHLQQRKWDERFPPSCLMPVGCGLCVRAAGILKRPRAPGMPHGSIMDAGRHCLCALILESYTETEVRVVADATRVHTRNFFNLI